MLEDYKLGTEVLGQWKIVRKIGEGSFGSVFEIEREEFGVRDRAALKVICVPQNSAELHSTLREGLTMEEAKSYFFGIVQEIVQEFAIMGKLKGCENVVYYEDHQVVPHPDGVGWDILIRMELLQPLQEYLQEHPMNREEVLQLGIHICRALAACERHQIIHRDLKPENILVSADGVFKLADFGIARTIERTMSGLSKKGTFSYMAPEVYRGGEYGFTVDLYALGLVLYRLLNGNRLPFMPLPPETIRFQDREQAQVRRLKGEPLPLPMDARDELGRIICKACAPDPGSRYHNAAELGRALERCLGFKDSWEPAAAALRPEPEQKQEQKPEPEPESELTQSSWEATQSRFSPEVTQSIMDPGASVAKKAKKPKKSQWLPVAAVCGVMAVILAVTSLRGLSRKEAPPEQEQTATVPGVTPEQEQTATVPGVLPERKPSDSGRIDLAELNRCNIYEAYDYLDDSELELQQNSSAITFGDYDITVKAEERDAFGKVLPWITELELRGGYDYTMAGASCGMDIFDFFDQLEWEGCVYLKAYSEPDRGSYLFQYTEDTVIEVKTTPEGYVIWLDLRRATNNSDKSIYELVQ